MRQACSVPAATGAALVPDAHVGYGLPIGGVLAVENVVIPYAVSVDIACCMKLSVLDKGHAASLNSASHCAGRCMSRKKAKEKFRWKAVQQDLEKKGVRVLPAAADEVPGVYKDIEAVIRHQADLVETVARFDPKIVKMCDDGSKAEY